MEKKEMYITMDNSASNDECIKECDTDINILINSSIEKECVAVGDIVTYNVLIKNDSFLDITNLRVSNTLDDKLEFVDGSVEVDGEEWEEENIIAGVNIPFISKKSTVMISFLVNVLVKGEALVNDVIQFIYETESGRECVKEIRSNTVKLIASNVDLSVVTTADKKGVVLGDIVTFTHKIVNTTELDLRNIKISGNFSDFLELVEGSFRLNNKRINNVHLDKGINIGSLKPLEKRIIEYSVRVIGNSYCAKSSVLIKANYDYILYDGCIGERVVIVEGSRIPSLEVEVSNFKQIIKEVYLNIDERKVLMDYINTLKSTIHINDYHLVETAKAISNEGQHLTGYKLIVNGDFNITPEYVGVNSNAKVYTQNYKIPFSTFIVMPKNYNASGVIDIEGEVNDIYYKYIDESTMFTSIKAKITAKIIA